MYCSKCKQENADTATFCSACGAPLSLKKTSVILLIVLTVVTLGIYYPVWFLTRRNAINNLQSKEKLGSGIFIFLIVLACVGFPVDLMWVVMELFAERLSEIGLLLSKGLDLFSNILSVVWWIILLVQCFKVRRIFKEHFNVHLQKDISFSWVATFFFWIFYLQYKVNRF